RHKDGLAASGQAYVLTQTIFQDLEAHGSHTTDGSFQKLLCQRPAFQGVLAVATDDVSRLTDADVSGELARKATRRLIKQADLLNRKLQNNFLMARKEA